MNMTSKMNTVSEIKVIDSDQSMDIEENKNDSMGWRSLPDIATTSEDSDSSDTNGRECIDDSFYEQNHTISNLEYAKLKLSNVAVKHLSIEPITALCDTADTCLAYQKNYFRKFQS